MGAALSLLMHWKKQFQADGKGLLIICTAGAVFYSIVLAEG